MPLMAGDSTQQPTDRDLFDRIADGDPTAVRPLMDRYDRLIRYTIFRTSRERCRQDPLWLDSVASEVWSDLCRSLRERGSVEIASYQSYFIQIARRRSIDALRRPGSAPLGSGSDAEEQMQVIDEKEDVPAIVGDLEEISTLRECISELGESDRFLCGELAAITAGRWKEAAGRLKVPESTLRSRWRRVLERLRGCLEKKSETVRASGDSLRLPLR